MFDLSKLKLGSDKKKELEDNIKEIRGLIESDTAHADQPQAPAQVPDQEGSGGQGGSQPVSEPVRSGQQLGSESVKPEQGPELDQAEPEERGPSPPPKTGPSDRAESTEGNRPQPARPEPKQATDPRQSSLEPSNLKQSVEQQTGGAQPSTGEETSSEEKQEGLKKPENLRTAVKKEKEAEEGQMAAKKGPGSGMAGKSSHRIKEVPKLSHARQFGASDEERGPLFIEEEDFYTAEDILSELNSLSNQLSDSIRNMENTLLEDEELARGIQQTISIFEETSEELESIFNS